MPHPTVEQQQQKSNDKHWYSGIVDGAETALNWVGNEIGSAEHKVENLISGINEDARDFASGVKDIITTDVGAVSGTIDHAFDTAGSTVDSLGNSFAWPLAIVGGAVALAIILK